MWETPVLARPCCLATHHAGMLTHGFVSRYAYTWVCNGVKAGERVGRRKATARICASPVHAYTYATYMRMYDTQMR